MIPFIKKVLLPLNIAEHVVDNYVFDKVQPVKGSVVYCDFIISGSIIQHSGIYIGNGEIVHLTRHGSVEKTTPSGFISGLGGLKCGSSIYVSCNGTEAVGCSNAASIAESEVGQSYDYSVIKYNCHQFIAECVSGYVLGPEYMDLKDHLKSTLTMLKIGCRLYIDSDNWRVWDR